ncbi:MAG: dihydrolipoyl dehydrogenase [Firmicutes bacterium]|nr:dihydrolipoyl dehydrogenase [Bacillota bacterium]MDD4264495.1 dihydrolipoyl dehydrogenase [Bacillota bacterium]
MTKLTIIGAGPGGYVAALRAANLGLEVTLIEKEHLGGTCLNWGCIPTKTYYHTAKLVEQAKNTPELENSEKLKLDFPKLNRKQEEVVSQLVNGVKSLLKAAGVEIIKGTGTLTVDGVKVGGMLVPTDYTIIATGASPFLIFGLKPDGKRIFTAKEIWQLTDLPESMVILGGGVIGVEFATIFSNLGTKVTIVEREKSILPQFAPQAVRQVAKKLKDKGVEILTSTSVTGYDPEEVALLVDDQKITGEVLLVALGNKANTKGLGLLENGITLNQRGEIIVDKNFETSKKGVYAIGDVTDSTYKLAHAASHAGVFVAEKLAGLDPYYREELVPRTVFTSPELAEVGVLEGKKSRFPFSANGRALSSGETAGFIEAYGDEEKLNGVLIVGPEACELSNLASYALAVGSSKEEMAKAVMTHPTLGETVLEASLGLFGSAIHMIKR